MKETFDEKAAKGLKACNLQTPAGKSANNYAGQLRDHYYKAGEGLQSLAELLQRGKNYEAAEKIKQATELLESLEIGKHF